MPTKRSPRKGSMQFWPRKRAKKETPRIRTTGKSSEPRPLVFAGYKVGMTHIIASDNRPNSMTKNEKISFPVTIIECPSLKICAVNFYKKHNNALSLSTSFISTKLDKELKRSIPLPKKSKVKIEDIKPEEYDEIRAVVYTQPKSTGIGKKKPELFEIPLGGNNQDKLSYLKENIGKEINIKDIFKPGQLVDIRAVTKGKGTQGPVKRFGISIRQHKSEKTKRGPGSLGGWKGQAHFMYRVAHAGQTGYHQRTEHNKWILKIGDNPEEINPKSGFQNYGVVKSPYILVKGSIPGPRKRLIVLAEPMRPNKKIPKETPNIIQIIK
jgi:large subunit ribosomal protein L3